MGRWWSSERPRGEWKHSSRRALRFLPSPGSDTRTAEPPRPPTTETIKETPNQTRVGCGVGTGVGWVVGWAVGGFAGALVGGHTRTLNGKI
jgi:hypothetical protein